MTPKTLEERLERLEQIVSELGGGERTLRKCLRCIQKECVFRRIAPSSWPKPVR